MAGFFVLDVLRKRAYLVFGTAPLRREEGVMDQQEKHAQLVAALNAQLLQATTGFNRWVTGVAVGHDPTNDECLKHYDEHKGSKQFRLEWDAEHTNRSSSA